MIELRIQAPYDASWSRWVAAVFSGSATSIKVNQLSPINQAGGKQQPRHDPAVIEYNLPLRETICLMIRI
jgi:hypothetical protein